MNIFKYIVYLFIGLFLVLFQSSCELEELVDPNRPSIGGFLENASPQELSNLIVGAEARMRNGYDTYLTATGSISRELYLFDADPRNTEDLLGKEGTQLDNNSFYLTANYYNRYRAIKVLNTLLEALDNTSSVTDTEKEGYRGFAKTLQAHQLLLCLNMLHDNGIRVDVSDQNNLGDFLSRAAAYTAISNLLDEAQTHLNNAGTSFSFAISSGFDGFDTPDTFLEFNRAIKARIALYQEDWNGVLTALGNSFYDQNAGLDLGPQHVFSTGAGDILNPIFYPANQGVGIMVHPSFISDAESGDTRVANKTRLRTTAANQDNLTATYEAAIASNTAPISIIRNEELILMAAEANIQLDQSVTAVNLLNIVRNAAGLADYSGATDSASLTNELLTQRRYSLWLEGHRMVDLRRYDRLNSTFVPIDRTGDIIHTQFPRPLNDTE